MNVFKNFQKNTGNILKMETENPMEFFKNWFNQQASYAKSMTEFNQNIQNNISSFGKPVQEFMTSFNEGNTTFMNLYNAWMSNLNSTYETINKQMNSTFTKDSFAQFFKGNEVFNKMEQFFQPMVNDAKAGKFSWEDYKNHFTPDAYAKLSKEIFGSFQNQSAIKDAFDNATKKLQDFFTTQNNFSKEYFAQWKKLNKNYSELFENKFSGSLKELSSKMSNIFEKTFEPLMKMVNDGAEKENIQNLIVLMDRMTQYSLKQAELQHHLQNVLQSSFEKLSKDFGTKLTDKNTYAHTPNVNELYNEWVKVSEKLFNDLFGNKEFNKVKEEALTLTEDLKKHFEKQFENMFSHTPLVFKSYAEEMQKNLSDLRKQVKDLQTKMMAASSTQSSKNEKNKKAKRK